jgi:hypothetical protein
MAGSVDDLPSRRLALWREGLPALVSIREAGREAWRELRPQHGSVVVPAGHEVAVSVRRGPSIDLRPLAELAPDALQVLDLGWTRTRDDDLVHLAGLTELRELDLGMTRITDAGARHLSGLRGLRVLKLAHTRLGDAGLAAIAVVELAELSLRGTRVTEASVPILRRIGSLQRLDVGDTAISWLSAAHDDHPQ